MCDSLWPYGLQPRILCHGILQGRVLKWAAMPFSGYPGGSEVKRLPAVQETWIRSLGQEDPLEKETATHSSTLAWKIPWTEEPGRLQSMGRQRVGHD